MNEFFKKPVVKILMLKGEKGDKGDTGTGTPTGGKAGQYLQKKTDADYDYKWDDITTVQWDKVTGKTNATQSSAGLMSAQDKTALDKLNSNGPNILHEYVNRPRSANNVSTSIRQLKWFLATSLMEEGKPAGDGGIIEMDWDNRGNGIHCTMQLYIPNNSHVPVQYRYELGAPGKWSEWHDIYSENFPQTSTTKSFTLSASSWSSGSYTISDSLITATSNQEVLPATNITADQMKALQKANIIDSGQSAGRLTLKALGTVPSIDIPIRIIFRGTI